MLTSGEQNTVGTSFQNYMVPIPMQQSNSTKHYDTMASYYAQRGVRPRQSVSVISSSEPFSSSVNVLTASSGMPSFSARTLAPSCHGQAHINECSTGICTSEKHGTSKHT